MLKRLFSPQSQNVAKNTLSTGKSGVTPGPLFFSRSFAPPSGAFGAPGGDGSLMGHDPYNRLPNLYAPDSAPQAPTPKPGEQQPLKGSGPAVADSNTTTPQPTSTTPAP